jgi:hypothetical protein
MAKFRAVGAMIIGDRKYGAGTIFVDYPTGIPGEVVYMEPGKLTKWNVGLNLIPIDAAARAMIAASRFANDPSWPTSGCSSIS